MHCGDRVTLTITLHPRGPLRLMVLYNWISDILPFWWMTEMSFYLLFTCISSMTHQRCEVLVIEALLSTLHENVAHHRFCFRWQLTRWRRMCSSTKCRGSSSLPHSDSDHRICHQHSSLCDSLIPPLNGQTRENPHYILVNNRWQGNTLGDQSHVSSTLSNFVINASCRSRIILWWNDNKGHFEVWVGHHIQVELIGFSTLVFSEYE